MEIHAINNQEYHMVNDIISLYPGFNTGCKTHEDIINYYDIEKKDYVYARFVNNSWKITKCVNKKLDIFFTF